MGDVALAAAAPGGFEGDPDALALRHARPAGHRPRRTAPDFRPPYSKDGRRPPRQPVEVHPVARPGERNHQRAPERRRGVDRLAHISDTLRAQIGVRGEQIDHRRQRGELDAGLVESARAGSGPSFRIRSRSRCPRNDSPSVTGYPGPTLTSIPCKPFAAAQATTSANGVAPARPVTRTRPSRDSLPSTIRMRILSNRAELLWREMHQS